MPELPEVEIMCRNLCRWAAGAVVQAAELVDERLLCGAEPAALSGLVGARVGPAARRGKYALLPLDTGSGRRWLVLHFRMTGKVVRDDGHRRRVRLRLSVARDGAAPTVLVFDDARCLGQCWLVDDDELDAFFGERGLGPEPWPAPRDGAWWAARLAGARGAIKPVLLQQHRVAGLGNIAASEVLFGARIDPRCPVPALPPGAFARLAAAVPAFIDHVLATESGDEIHFVSHGGPNPFAVYGRAGAPCPACGGTIARAVQAGRATFWCPACQGA